MAKKSAGKLLSPQDLQKKYERIMKDYEPFEPQVAELRSTPQIGPSEVIVVRDYVTYSAYEDPVEG
jgi:hypothetical protein